MGIALCPDCQKSYLGGECLGCRVSKLRHENKRLKEIIKEAVKIHDNLTALLTPELYIELFPEQAMPTKIEKIKLALADPNAPWYGSDLVEQVGDFLEDVEALVNTAKQLLED